MLYSYASWKSLSEAFLVSQTRRDLWRVFFSLMESLKMVHEFKVLFSTGLNPDIYWPVSFHFTKQSLKTYSSLRSIYPELQLLCQRHLSWGKASRPAGTSSSSQFLFSSLSRYPMRTCQGYHFFMLWTHYQLWDSWSPYAKVRLKGH